MNRYPGPSPAGSGQPMGSVGGYAPPPNIAGHIHSPQTAPYNVAAHSPTQYGQTVGAGSSSAQNLYPHPSSQPGMAGGSNVYGQPMMQTMMAAQQQMQQSANPPPQPQVQAQAQQQPVQGQGTTTGQQPVTTEDLSTRVKRTFTNLENNLRTFLGEYSTILQMDDARLNSQTPEFLANRSQVLVRRYETLLVALDLFESTMRMLQDHTVTQMDFRRLTSAVVNDPRRAQLSVSMDPGGHGQYPGINPMNRQGDPSQYQSVLHKMQGQIDSCNALKEIAKRFLESSSANINQGNK